ncbi:MAG: DUF1800 domain-containing protein [Chloroflexi bacterium]|nr:DUF1800 domain-containing protein [Ardenticatenaceae bacterium]MBL1131400.1 DUF1800 domain-containing protein [Chloroflexota bacterium]NOG37507.1 DUF1800 domain-containing protein [Chloroflexota bacterium]
MSLSRRDFLKLGSLTAVATVTGCSVIGREVSRRELPQALVMPGDTAVSTPIHRLLNRAGYGPRPGDLERVAAMGLVAYLEEQLNPEAIDDTAVDLLLRSLTLYHMDASQLVEQDEEDAAVELITATIWRALNSKRQMYEAMVEFWSDHFNIYLRKNRFMPLLKMIDDRDVIRPHALGKFRDLLAASAHSPAMLVYLDNQENSKDAPNENYARELLELHTLGVHAGYTQKDVQEVARILTGWTVQRNGRRKGQFTFNPDQHDGGPKTVLGQTIRGDDGETEVAALLELLATHPATAHFIATKLARRFVADEPPAALVNRIAQTYQETDGDIKAMLRVLFLSEEFASAPPKLKRPYTYLLSVLRALHADLRPTRNRAVGRVLAQMGQLPFHWPPPDGYPDDSAAWAGNLLPRWNVALAMLHGELSGVRFPWERIITAGNAQTAPQVLQLFGGLVYGRALHPTEFALFTDYVGNRPLHDHETQQRLRDSIALMLASPAFQWT